MSVRCHGEGGIWHVSTVPCRKEDKEDEVGARAPAGPPSGPRPPLMGGPGWSDGRGGAGGVDETAMQTGRFGMVSITACLWAEGHWVFGMVRPMAAAPSQRSTSPVT
ncbi:hypothetical protein ColTof4_02332 [Colletotrichum tofieldiae]|nr:hypothetical protein ColTof3_09379 [Colletotrichum tofieldiae]GKT69909.1 hypothetical protein ColTof4_02332 [Colletotrichum tofieldiae]